MSAANDSQDPFPAPRRFSPRHLVRSFAVFAALVMVTVAFGVVGQPARADTTAPSTLNTTAAPGTAAYDAGSAVTGLSGAAQVANYANFRRWDGVWEPVRALNFSTGDWPYRVNETASSFTVSLGGLAFTQGKIPGATYAYQPDRIEETIRINASFPTPVMAPSIYVPFSTTYLPLVNRASVSLYSYSGSLAWTTAPFRTWDSAKTPGHWANAVASIQLAPGGLSLVLNATVTSIATYPLYIDPTWTLGGVGWGASTFANATMDLGDGSVKIGNFADNFNNNQGTGWSFYQGGGGFSGGAMNVNPNSGVSTPGPFSDFSWQSDIDFSSSRGTNWANLHFCITGLTCNLAGYYTVAVYQSNGTVDLQGYTATIIGAFSTTISLKTVYTVRIVAEGNYYEVWWNGVRKLAVTDPSPPPAGQKRNAGVGYYAYLAGTGSTFIVDNVRVWNTNSGSITTPKRDASKSGNGDKALSTEILGTVDAYNQVHVAIRSSADNMTWGPWTNVKADVAAGIFYNEPDQGRQQYYQLQVTLSSGTNATPVLTQITTSEGPLPSTNPTANTGYEAWYPYAGGMVNLVNGNLYYTATDILFQGKGFALAVTRSYNSLLNSTPGPFGYGWTFTYGQSLTLNSNGNVTWNGPDGAQFLFVAKGTTGGFSPPVGVPDRLLKNSDGTYTLWMPDGSTEHFDSSGMLLSITDRNADTLTLAYSSGKTPLLLSVTDGAGKALSFSYDKYKHIASVTDPLNRIVYYGYTGANDDVNLVRDPLGFQTSYAYFGGHRFAGLLDPVGKEINFNYDASTPARVTKVWLADDSAPPYLVYSFNEYVIAYPSATTRTVTNARGYATTVTLNSAGNIVQFSGPSIGCGCDSVGNSSSYLWDGEMNRIQTADARGDSWSMSYGFRDNLLTTKDPGGNLSSGIWLEANNATNYFVVPASTTTFRGFTTTYAYDAKGNRLSVTDPNGNRSLYGYDPSGFLNKTVSARTYTTWFVYNASGYLVRTVDPMNDVTQYAYDILGRPTSVTSPGGFVTTTAYDADGHVTSVTDPLLHSTTYGYDYRGDLVRITDPDQRATTYTINVTSAQIQSTTDSGGNTTTNTYDLRNNLVAVQDANHHTTSYSYDSFDRLATTTTPMGEVTRFVYDVAGNRIARTDGNGYTTTYAYDKLNRVMQVHYPGPPVYSTPQTLTFAYDPDGNSATATGFGYTEARAYDKSDRLSSTSFNYGTFIASVSYTYDADGNRATLKDSSGATTSYTHDRADRLSSIKDPENDVTSFFYDRDARPNLTVEIGGAKQVQLYDKASHLTTMYTNGSSGTIEKIAYAYDNAGYRISETDTAGTTSTTTTYVYDKVERLYSTTQGSTTTVDRYDAVGNPIQENAPSTVTYFNNQDDELIYANYTGGISWLYTYDSNGNRVSQSNQGHGSFIGFSYDYENRLISTTKGTADTYSPTGERASSSQVVNSVTVTTYYGYDYGSPGGPALIADYASGGARSDRYTQSGGPTSPVEQFTSGGHYAYTADGLGSVRRVTDSNGNTVDTYAYDSWGGTTPSGSLANPFQYAAMPVDTGTGATLYDAGARFYDPSSTGAHEFLGRDPLGGGYAYAGDSPVNYVDPTGRMYAQFGGGGGTGGGTPAPQCSLAQELNGDCPSETGGGSGSPGGNSPTLTPSWQTQECYAADTLFVIGLVLSILGLSFGSAKMLMWAGAVAGLSLAADIPGIISHWQSDPLGALGSIVDFAWTFITSLVIPSLNIWDALTIGGETVVRITPPGFAASLAFAVFTNALAFGGLVAGGCIPQL